MGDAHEENLPDRLAMPSSHIQGEMPILRLEVDDDEFSHALMNEALHFAGIERENALRAVLTELLEEHHNELSTLGTEIAMLKVENRNLRRQIFRVQQRAFTTSSWHCIYLLKAIEASFDKWKAQRPYSEFPFRLLRNVNLTEEDYDLTAPIAILPCLPSTLHVFPNPNECLHCSSEDMASIQLPDEVGNELPCDVEFLSRFRGGKHPSILITAHVVRTNKEMNICLERTVGETFQISSAKLLLAFFIFLDPLDHIKELAVIAANHVDPSARSIIAMTPKNPDFDEICSLDVEGITYAEANDNTCGPWRIDTRELWEQVEESLYGYLEASIASSGGETVCMDLVPEEM